MKWAEKGWALEKVITEGLKVAVGESCPYSLMREIFVEKINELSDNSQKSAELVEYIEIAKEVEDLRLYIFKLSTVMKILLHNSTLDNNQQISICKAFDECFTKEEVENEYSKMLNDFLKKD